MIPLSFPMWQVAHGGTQAPWHHEPITNLKSTWENEGCKNVRFCSSIFITNLRKMSPNINLKSTTYLQTNLTSEQSNWVPKLQRLSVQQIFHLSKKNIAATGWKEEECQRSKAIQLESWEELKTEALICEKNTAADGWKGDECQMGKAYVLERCKKDFKNWHFHV